VQAILIAGILVGVLDICAAFVVRYAFMKAPPLRVLQGIASGAMGPAAFSGGLSSAGVGLALHFVIAFGVAAVYFAMSRRLRIFIAHPLWVGAAYGIGVHLFMNYVVLPLSRFPRGGRPPTIWFFAAMAAVHILCVGWPVALVVARCSQSGTTPRVATV